MIGKERERRLKETMISAAFTAWLQGAGPEKTFPQFLRHYGLAEAEPIMSKDEKRLAVRKAKQTAERIIKMDRKHSSTRESK